MIYVLPLSDINTSNKSKSLTVPSDSSDNSNKIFFFPCENLIVLQIMFPSLSILRIKKSRLLRIMIPVAASSSSVFLSTVFFSMSASRSSCIFFGKCPNTFSAGTSTIWKSVIPVPKAAIILHISSTFSVSAM